MNIYLTKEGNRWQIRVWKDVQPQKSLRIAD